jgi:hypothetical protein
MMARRDSTLRGRPTRGRVTGLLSELSVLVMKPLNRNELLTTQTLLAFESVINEERVRAGRMGQALNA